MKSAVVPCTFHLTGTAMFSGLFRAVPNSRSADMVCKMYESMRRRPWWATRRDIDQLDVQDRKRNNTILPGLSFISKQHKRIYPTISLVLPDSWTYARKRYDARQSISSSSAYWTDRWGTNLVQIKQFPEEHNCGE